MRARRIQGDVSGDPSISICRETNFYFDRFSLAQSVNAGITCGCIMCYKLLNCCFYSALKLHFRTTESPLSK